MPVLRIQHTTTYRHQAPAAMAWQIAHLQPREEAGQVLKSFELDVSPRPQDLSPRTDYFGNTAHAFSVQGPLRELTITSTSRVAREAPALPEADMTPSLAIAVEATDAAVLGGQFELEQYRHASPLVPLLPEALTLAAEIEDPDLPLLEWLRELGVHFASKYSFDPHATTVSTPLATVLRQRRGVCQDFSHALISCLRQCGLPAAYVSGYLLTTPPPGQPRLRGADAMHAWVSVYFPGHGWVDYDPTNRCFAGASHVVVARGRDYRDVSPLHGLFRGGARHSLLLGVTAEIDDDPIEPAEAG